MSLKGLGKSLTRAPQQVKQRFNIGENTKDAIYIDAERRFQDLERETKKLHEESRKYFDAINGMLSHQIEFSRAMVEIYNPISGRMSDPDSFVSEDNEAGIRACEEYEAIVKELQQSLSPELEMIEQRVIAPANELMEIIKACRKVTVKRQHKQLDYDRHRTTLKKLQEKKDKSVKDEKAMYRAEADVEQATQEFDYFNDLLKDELPKLFRLEREFIQPLFQSFYYMQLNVFYTLHERMQNIDIGYFNLTLPIEEAWQDARGDIQERVEAISITKFRKTGHKKPGAMDRFKQGRLGSLPSRAAIKDRPDRTTSEEGESSTAMVRRRSHEDSTPPPPYSAAFPSAVKESNIVRDKSVGSSWGTAAKAKGPAPPPPKPKPSRLSGAPATPTAVALYDYEAQADGDLSFSAGDVIEITVKGTSENEWWTGKLRGKEGQFPGNYVKVN